MQFQVYFTCYDDTNVEVQCYLNDKSIENVYCK